MPSLLLKAKSQILISLPSHRFTPAVNCDILLTHSPSIEILDRFRYWDRSHDPPIAKSNHLGSRSLLRLVRTMQPALHIHGHAHDSRGSLELAHDVDSLTRISEPEEWYWVGGQYIWQNILRRSSNKTWVVNAAMKPGALDRDQNLRTPIVVDLKNK